MKNLMPFGLSGLFLGVALFVFVPTILASDGVVELRSTNDKDYRCFALSSILETTTSYTVLVTCRELIYPPEASLISYMMWANPVDGGNALRLGKLGVGKAMFKSPKAFSSLFVTTESSTTARTPQGEVVMTGTIGPISFLERPTTPTPTPTPTEEGGEDQSQANGSEEEKDASQLTTRQKLILGLQRAGLVALIALIAIVGLVFVVSRSRS